VYVCSMWNYWKERSAGEFSALGAQISR